MSDYLKEISNACGIINMNAFTLEDMSRAFYVTGNKELADTLCSIVDELQQAQRVINGATSKNVNDMHDRAQQSTTNMINACLAVNQMED